MTTNVPSHAQEVAALVDWEHGNDSAGLENLCDTRMTITEGGAVGR